MHLNQRARLVLHPITLSVLLVAAGLGAGIGIALWRPDGFVADPATGKKGSSSSLPIVVSSDRLDFGEIPIERTAVRQLLLRNNGSSSLRVRFEGTGAAFAVEPTELTLEPGKISRVSVRANPTKPGALRDELRIYTDDAAAEPLVVTLVGQARAATAQDVLSATANPGPRAAPAAPTEATPGRGAAPVLLDRRPAAGALPPPVTPGRGAEPGAVVITSNHDVVDEGGAAEPGVRQTPRRPGASPSGVVGVPVDSTPRSISDRSETPSAGEPGEGENAVPVGRRSSNSRPALDQRPKPGDTSQDPPPATPAFSISESSSMSVLGSTNRFYPQSVGALGSDQGGSFSLASALQLPTVPLAFGQSMAFAQTASVVGSFDPSSGQVTLELPMQAVDANGDAAPFVVSLTTGTVLARNDNGILISMSGDGRAPGSGQLRLVGIGKIPLGYRNGAEDHIVSIEVVGALHFPTTTQVQSNLPSDEDGGMGSLR